MGFHTCPYPHRKESRFPATSSGDVLLAFTNGHSYTMPDMIIHYVADHGWLPPVEFVEDVMTGTLAIQGGARAQTRSVSIGAIYAGTRIGYLDGPFETGPVPEDFVDRLEELMRLATEGGERAQTKSPPGFRGDFE